MKPKEVLSSAKTVIKKQASAIADLKKTILGLQHHKLAYDVATIMLDKAQISEEEFPTTIATLNESTPADLQKRAEILDAFDLSTVLKIGDVESDKVAQDYDGQATGSDAAERNLIKSICNQ